MARQGEKILIVGAGPVGLTLAWLLIEHGFKVSVFESDPEISDQLRASTFHPPTLDMFADSGISAELIANGRKTPTWQIRMHETGEKAEFDLDVLADETQHPYRLQCRQANLSKALFKRLPADIVQFGAEVDDVSQTADGVSVTANNIRHDGDYVVGCDGARSIVRKTMGADFSGETYPENTILATTRLPFENYIEGLSGVNYIWRPGGTYSLLRLPEVWRISLYPDQDQTPEAAMTDENIKAQTRAIVPDAPEIEVLEKRIYRVHRRVAETYRKGRMFLAGDAAHLNSPKGGMGMNGGIHDAFSLVEKLVRVRNGEDEDLLNQYERQRKPIAMEEILAQADTNRQRMNTTDPNERRMHLENLQRIAADRAKAREFLLKSSMFTGLRRAEAIL